MRWLASMVLALAALIGTSAGAEAPQLKQSASIVLRYPAISAVGADDAERLTTKALEVLRSSNFNSTDPRFAKDWDEAELALKYGAAISSRHLVVSFIDPQTIETMGGKVVVKEIVIGLNYPDRASSLHTIDDQGRVVGHGKYNGTLCVQLLDMVTALAR